VETRAVIFDMDGVLVDSGAHHRAAWKALLDELAVAPAEPDYWRLTIGRPSVEAVPLLLGRATSWAEAQRLAARKQEHYRRLAAGGPALVQGVAAFVAELATRRVPRAVATSASRHDVEGLLTRAGLRERFEVVVAAEDVRRGKPDPEVYLLAARRLGVAPEHCLVFEDAVVGVQAARSAGMRTIGVSTAHTETELRAAGAERAVEDFEGVTWPA
jgi:beta-phosphoglucomutase family hydrolase